MRRKPPMQVVIWGYIGITYPNNGESMEKNMETEMETREHIGGGAVKPEAYKKGTALGQLSMWRNQICLPR